MIGKYLIVIESEDQEGFKDFGEALESGIKHSGYKCLWYRFKNVKSLEEAINAKREISSMEIK